MDAHEIHGTWFRELSTTGAGDLQSNWYQASKDPYIFIYCIQFSAAILHWPRIRVYEGLFNATAPSSGSLMFVQCFLTTVAVIPAYGCRLCFYFFGESKYIINWLYSVILISCLSVVRPQWSFVQQVDAKPHVSACVCVCERKHWETKDLKTQLENQGFRKNKFGKPMLLKEIRKPGISREDLENQRFCKNN